jgi:type III secretion protein W
MSHEPIHSVNASSSMSSKQAQIQKAQAQERMQGIEVVQVETKECADECRDNLLFNPFVQLKKGESLDNRIKKPETRKSSESEKTDPEEIHIEGIEKSAEEFQNRNPEMQKRGLLGLRKALLLTDTPEQILEKILLSYPDPYLADEAFEFLLRHADPDSPLGINIKKARNLLTDRFGREIKAGKNINEEVKEFEKQGLGAAGSLRDLYRDITGTHREPIDLFEELSEAYPFPKLKSIILFMLHSLGSDLKSKGPSIAPGELQKLFTEIRSMQAIYGVYYFFYKRMNLIINQFKHENLIFPPNLTFAHIAKTFVKLIAERYPSPDKILKLGSLLGISEELLAQAIVFTQFRDAMRGVSPRLFKSEKHRQDLLMVLVETLSELDDLLEEDEENPK